MINTVYGERVINLKDMLYWTLKHWRKILAGAVIIALLAGAYKMYSGLRVLLDDEKYADAQEKYEITLADYKATGERLKTKIVNLREQSAHQQEYNEKSVLMKIDPMDKWSGYFQIYIDSKYQIDPSLSYQNLDMTNRLISAYASYLRSGELYQEILAQMPGIDEIRFLTEVYGVSADPGTATLMVSCVGASEADVRQLLGFAKTKFAEKFETVRSAIGDHSYEVLTESVYSTIDLNLEATQKSNLEAIADYANAIGETNEQLSEWEKEPEPRPEYGAWYTTKQMIKFIILGGIIGIIVMCVWFAVKYAASDTIKTDADWRAFQLPVLGHIMQDGERKKFLPGLDKLFDKLFGRTCMTTLDQSCILTAQNLGATLKERSLTIGALVGRLPNGLAETLAQKMDSADAGVSFRYAGDALNDPTTAKNLDGLGEVFVICERYTTHSADVNQLLTLLRAWGKTALGVVLLE